MKDPRRGAPVDPARVGRRTASGRRLVRALGPLVRLLFRPRIEGIEHLPDGPFLLVANHSAGMGAAEIASFAWLWIARLGDRPLAGFALPAGFRVWPISALHRAFGSVPSTYAAAAEALAAGVPILVFPGGDHETLRPVWQAGRVDFGERHGFVRIARDAGVPIVPMGIRGSHFTAPMLLRARWLATALVLPRLLGVKRWGISLLGVIGAMALMASPMPWPLSLALTWLWLGTPLVFLPIVPWSVRFRVGPPLPIAGLVPAGAPAEAALAEARARVEAAVAAGLRERAAQRGARAPS